MSTRNTLMAFAPKEGHRMSNFTLAQKTNRVRVAAKRRRRPRLGIV